MADHGWTERFTMDGVPYYHNTRTEAVSWDKPDVLKSTRELKSDAGTWRWVPDPVLAWAPAREERVEPSGVAVCVLDSGERVTVSPKVPRWPLLKSSLRHLEEDLVLVDDMNEGLILHNLRERYKLNEIYTNIGTILVSINPFQRLPLYTPTMIDKYYHSGGNKRLPPHIFGIADAAYKAMLYDKKNQSILISGESGAGKTEATKQCLAFFAEVAGSESNVEQKIVQANPILEAFGNAKTLRNNNSSRFGKYMEIHFDKFGKIVGARTENYLLEKSRVVTQTPGERNYHIFYQLCTGHLAERFGLYPDPEQYYYLNRSGCISVDDMDDREEFIEVCKAMETLGFEQEEQDWLFSVVAAVLHLGNIHFDLAPNKTSSVIHDKTPLLQAAELLAVDPVELENAILLRTMVIPGQPPTKIPFKPADARATCDALAKAIYGNCFDWLVQRINQSVVVAESLSKSYIGVLDIFGFEIFEKNSFEQLCINFANEKLQQHFNNYTFKLEEQCYQQEQINFTHIEFIDNQPILDLIEKRPAGLLVLLDEEIVFPKGTDLSYCQKIKQQHGKSEYFKSVMKVDLDFIINHYAGTVTYDSTGFLDKNRDTLYDDLQLTMANSKNARLAALFPPPAAVGKKKISLGGQFRIQLNDLMNKLNATEPHYVRCIKPNPNKRALEFNSVLSLEQLRYAGVFEAIRIRQSGFPFRYTHSEFVRRYMCLSLKDHGWVRLSAQDNEALCRELLRITKQDFSQVQMGISKVLYRASEQRVLELLRNLALERVAVKVQAFARGCLARKFHARLVRALPILLEALKTRTDLELTEQALARTADIIGPIAIILPFEIKEVTQCKELLRQLRERKRVSQLLAAVLPRDPEAYFDQLASAVAQGDAIVEYPGTPKQLELYHEAKAKLELTIARRETRAQLVSGVEAADKELINEAIERAIELGIGECGEVRDGRQELARIAREERVLAELLEAIEIGGCVQYTPEAQEYIDGASLESVASTASAFGMRTAEGAATLTLANLLVRLRYALSEAPDWQATDGVAPWPEVAEILEDEYARAEWSFERASELAWATDELSLRTHRREVLLPLEEALAALDEKLIVAHLGKLESEALESRLRCDDQRTRLEELQSELVARASEARDQLVAVRRQLTEAVVEHGGGDEELLLAALEAANALPVTSTTAAHLVELHLRAELLVALKFHVPEGQRTEVGLVLDEALAAATEAMISVAESGEVLAVAKDTIVYELHTQLTALDEALQRAHDSGALEAKSVKASSEAQRTLAHARAIAELRRALVDGDWARVEHAIQHAMSVGANTPDLQLARDEVAGRAAAEDVLTHLEAALADMATPYTEQPLHASEAVFETNLAAAERLQMRELDAIVQARAMLERIRETRAALDEALCTDQYNDYLILAEGFEALYGLFDASTALLQRALALAGEFAYETQQVSDARFLLHEITVLGGLQRALQHNGYYDGRHPRGPVADEVSFEELVSAYEPAATLAARTSLGVYIILKSYHTIQLRGGLKVLTVDWQALEGAVSGALTLEYHSVELVSARELLDAVKEALVAMQQAEELVVQRLLEESVAQAEALYYENEYVARVRALRERVTQLNEESRQALWVLDRKRMEQVSRDAAEIRLSTAHLERLNALLALGEEDFLKLEIKKAREINDPERKIRLAIRLKVLSLNQFESMFDFAKLRSLRNPQDFAAQKLLTTDRKKLTASFLQFSKVPIHTSLTTIEDPLLLKDAKRCFKNVMGYMHDKKYPFPTTCAQELVNCALQNPPLRTEIYCQIIKQITGHPIVANQMRGWDLMAICLSQFPPNPDMENVLEIFLRSAPQRVSKYIACLRDTTYGPLRNESPSADELDAFVAAFNDPRNPTRTSDFELEKPVLVTAYPQEFFDNPENLFLATEIELK